MNHVMKNIASLMPNIKPALSTTYECSCQLNLVLGSPYNLSWIAACSSRAKFISPVKVDVPANPRIRGMSSFPTGYTVRVVVKRSSDGPIYCELFHQGSQEESSLTIQKRLSYLKGPPCDQLIYVDGIQRSISSSLYNILQARQRKRPWSLTKADLLVDALYFNEDSLSEKNRASNRPLLSYYPTLSGPTSIRLIVIEKLDRGHTAPIVCRLVNVDLSNRPRYQAVSYEWGNPSAEQMIIYVNGFPRPVRKNLFDALQRFRTNYKGEIDGAVDGGENPRYLWIDALCINQNDINERNNQVQLMGKIYKEASNVLIWLGVPEPGRDNVLSTLKKLASFRNSETKRRSRYYNYIHESFESETDFDVMNIGLWCDMSYWHRMWIVQEIQLAARLHIYYGEGDMEWTTFTEVRKFFIEDFGHVRSLSFQKMRESLAFRFDEYRQKRFKCPLNEWLVLCEDSECDDPRDKIYALLGIATDTHGTLFADYSISLSQLYRDVMILYWPNWNNEHQGSNYGIFGLSQLLQKTLNRPNHRINLTEHDLDPIWICGILSGTIKQIHSSSYLQGDGLVPKTTANSRLLASKASKAGSFIWIEYTNSFCLVTQGVGSKVDKIEPLPLQRITQSSYENICWLSLGKKFGFGPRDTQIGDMICQFPNSKLALVLRKDTYCWRLVGRAVMYETLIITDREGGMFWSGNPEDGNTLSNGPENAVYLQLNLVSLQRLTALEYSRP